MRYMHHGRGDTPAALGADWLTSDHPMPYWLSDDVTPEQFPTGDQAKAEGRYTLV